MAAVPAGRSMPQLAEPRAAATGSLLSHVRVRLQQRAALRQKTSRVARVIGDHAATLAALGFADTAMWHLGTVWGFLGTAVAIIVAEDKVRG